jgi:acyl-coenzyme A thioesterase PaaI-like protein
MKPVALEDDGYCFACGQKNNSGLRLAFKTEGGKTFAEFIPRKSHQGFKDIVHGGIITAVLDEAMMKAVLFRGIFAMTAEIAVRFRSPLLVGDRSVVEAEINTVGGRFIEASAVLKKADEVVAMATAKMLTPKTSDGRHISASRNKT